MSIKKYFKRQFQLRKFCLEHDVASEFYLSSIQRNRSILPLLIIRTLIFAGCLGTVIASLVLTLQVMAFNYWVIYLTHWGIVLNTVAAGFALAVSVTAYIKGTIEGSEGLPWYVKVYWLMFNIAGPIAVFITIFYWSLLTSVDQDFAINLTLDIFIHGINSVLMLALLLASRHPMYLLHFYFPIGIGIIYLIFTVIYYFAGGKDIFGNHTIYPMIDWENPGPTVGIVALSALGIFILHALLVAFAAGRDALGKRCRRETVYVNDEAYYS